MQVVEVIRPRTGELSKTNLTFYLKLTDSAARGIPKTVENDGEEYITSHFYLLKCSKCGNSGHKANRCEKVTTRKEAWLKRLAEAYQILPEDRKQEWMDALPEELQQANLN